MFYNFARGLVWIFLHLFFRFRVYGRENIPPEHGAILAVNHRSNWDPVAAAVAYPYKLSFMAKEELFKNPVFGGLIRSLGAFPVSRGAGDIGAIKSSLSLLKQQKTMLIFPQGHRMKTKGKAKPGVAMLAQRAKVPVVPLKIIGEYKLWHRVDAVFGEPILLDEYYGKKLTHEETQELADKVLDTIWGLEA